MIVILITLSFFVIIISIILLITMVIKQKVQPRNSMGELEHGSLEGRKIQGWRCNQTPTSDSERSLKNSPYIAFGLWPQYIVNIIYVCNYIYIHMYMCLYVLFPKHHSSCFRPPQVHSGSPKKLSAAAAAHKGDEGASEAWHRQPGAKWLFP